MVRENECNAFAFYGVNRNAVVPFFEASVSLFADLDCTPKRLESNSRRKPFGIEAPRLRKSKFKGVTSFVIDDVEKGFALTNGRIAAWLDVDDLFGVIAVRTGTVTLERLFEFCKPLAQKIGAEYGTGYVHKANEGPHWYAVGILFGGKTIPDDMEEAQRICDWSTGMEERVWRNGILRDVYNFNLLNERQLAGCVHGIPLNRWIGLDTSRGTLQPCSNKLTSWTVPPRKIKSIRTQLDEAHLLYQIERDAT